MVNSKNALIIFARYPEKGKVKTRLAKTLGEDFAMNFYRLCAEHTFNESLELINDVQIYLFFSDYSKEQKIKNWVNPNFKVSFQKGNDLGAKMKNAFEFVFNEGFEKAIIIGTDLPDITANLLTESFYLLSKFDIVIGPSSDGGYYLLGLKDVFNELFENIKWSTSEVYEQTIEKIIVRKLKHNNLKKLNDIDTENDIKKWIVKNTRGKLDELLNRTIKLLEEDNKFKKRN